jgi:hypothetical protein
VGVSHDELCEQLPAVLGASETIALAFTKDVDNLNRLFVGTAGVCSRLLHTGFLDLLRR